MAILMRAPQPSSNPTTRMKAGSNQPQATNSSHVVLPTKQVLRNRSQPLDLSNVPTTASTVSSSSKENGKRLFGLEVAPTYYPTHQEFKEPLKYIESIVSEGKKYGIVKIIPPDGWQPTFALDTEVFRFKTRSQKLNSMEGETRAHLNYLEQLYKFHRQRGSVITSIPMLDRKPVNLYRLRKLVARMGGFEKVTQERRWTEIGRLLGYNDPFLSSLPTSIKAIYAKIVWPYENYLATRTPTPSPFGTPTSKSNSRIHESSYLESPTRGTEPIDAIKSEIKDEDDEQGKKSRPIRSSRMSSSGRPDFDRMVTPPPQPQQTRVAAPKTGEEAICEICIKGDDEINMLLCDECDRGYHLYCLNPPLTFIPKTDWFCDSCLISTGGDYGFEEGQEYSLAEFKKKANDFKRKWFSEHSMDLETGLPPTQPLRAIDVEREYWRLVESVHETVEVEYGADVHSSIHGSGFPTLEKNPTDPYSTDGWNLNVMPILPESLFCHIKSDISGMTVPWVYVGMCFSTFCWHTEDHYTYSINYQHWGDIKTWYGIPADNADKFEATMKSVVPELFEQQPDLLFQLVTIMSPERLVKEGVKVYAIDQQPNQFVITFPQAYHAGFNHGFNFNEAVNFTLGDWAPYGLACVERYKQFRKLPVFSHDELLVTAGLNDNSVKTAMWLKDALANLRDRELNLRRNFRTSRPEIPECLEEVDRPDEEYQCKVCKVYCYLSHVACQCTLKIVCTDHIDELCIQLLDDNNLTAHIKHKVEYRLRLTDDYIFELASKVNERATLPAAWKEKLNKAMLEYGRRPPLRVMRSLLSEAERIPYPIEEAVGLKKFVDKCNGWVEEATGLLVRKHVKRKSEGRHPRRKSGRGEDTIDEDDTAHADPSEGKRKPEEIDRLIRLAERLPFDAPEIDMLKQTKQAIDDFRSSARRVLANPNATLNECKQIRDVGSGLLNIFIQEALMLENHIARLEWRKTSDNLEDPTMYELNELKNIVDEGHKCGLETTDSRFTELLKAYEDGVAWRDEVIRLISKEGGYTLEELEAIMKKSSDVPLEREAFTKLQTVLNKAEDWVAHVEKLKMRSDDNDITKRPELGEGRRVLKQLDSLSLNEPVLVNWVREKVDEATGLEKKIKELFLDGKSNGRTLVGMLEEVFERMVNAASTDDCQHQVEPVEASNEGKKVTKDKDSEGMIDMITVELMEIDKRDRAIKTKNTGAASLEKLPVEITTATIQEISQACTLNPEAGSMEISPQLDIKNEEKQSVQNGQLDVKDSRSVYRRYCICRMPESGLMVECEICHEWYHSSCMKLSKKRAKQTQSYICPLCDPKLEMPRINEMKRPKLEAVRCLLHDLQSLSFTLFTETAHIFDIVKVASEFEELVNNYLNTHKDVPYSVADVGDLKFYLRKMEGMDIQLKTQHDFIRSKINEFIRQNAPLAVKEEKPVETKAPEASIPPRKKWHFLEEKPVFDAAGERLYCLCHKSPPKGNQGKLDTVPIAKDVSAAVSIAKPSLNDGPLVTSAKTQFLTGSKSAAQDESIDTGLKSDDDGNQMIGCDVKSCGNWFHYACVGLSTRKADSIETYTCPGCSVRKGIAYPYARVIVVAKGAGRDGEVLLDQSKDEKDGVERVTLTLRLIRPRTKPAGIFTPLKEESSKVQPTGSNDDVSIVKINKPKIAKRPADPNVSLPQMVDGVPEHSNEKQKKVKKRKTEMEHANDEEKVELKAARRKVRKENKEKKIAIEKLARTIPAQILPPTGTFSTGYVPAPSTIAPLIQSRIALPPGPPQGQFVQHGRPFLPGSSTFIMDSTGPTHQPILPAGTPPMALQQMYYYNQPVAMRTQPFRMQQQPGQEPKEGEQG